MARHIDGWEKLIVESVKPKADGSFDLKEVLFAELFIARTRTVESWYTDGYTQLEHAEMSGRHAGLWDAVYHAGLMDEYIRYQLEWAERIRIHEDPPEEDEEGDEEYDDDES